MTENEPNGNAEYDRITGEFDTAELEHELAIDRLEKAGNFISKSFAAFRLRSAEKKLGEAFEQGEGLHYLRRSGGTE